MSYTTDTGVVYLVEVDESNGEACGFGDCTTENQGNPILPSRFTMRYINCVKAGVSGEDSRRKFWVGNQSTLQDLVAARAVTVDGVAYNVRSFRGEKATFPIPIDTGLNDGDAT
jgi:hypothetical protein